MPDRFNFSTAQGKVFIDLRDESTFVLREGLEPDTMVVESYGVEPIVVNMNYDWFIAEYFDHINESVPVKKEPRPASAKRGSKPSVVHASTRFGPKPA